MHQNRANELINMRFEELLLVRTIVAILSN